MSKLLDAIRRDDDRAVRSLLSEGWNPAADNAAPLKLAISKNNFKIVQILINDWRIDQRILQNLFGDVCKHSTPEIARIFLDYPWFNPENQDFQLAAGANNLKIVRLLLTDPRIDPADDQSGALHSAAEQGFLEMVKLLLKDPRINPADDDSYGLRKAFLYQHFDVVETLLLDGRSDPTFDDNTLLEWSILTNNLKFVKILLKDPRVDISINGNFPLVWACSKGYIGIVKYLLADPRINLNETDFNSALIEAMTQKQMEILRFLLDNSQFRPNIRFFGEAIIEDNIEIVKILLDDPRVDPSSAENFAIVIASTGGHPEMVKLLLADPRVDPSDQGSLAIYEAAGSNYIEIVELLLADPRVSLQDQEESVLVNSVEHQYVEIVKLLLNDPRTDTTFDDNEALKIAVKNGYREIEELIRKDLRKYPTFEIKRNNFPIDKKIAELRKDRKIYSDLFEYYVNKNSEFTRVPTNTLNNLKFHSLRLEMIDADINKLLSQKMTLSSKVR